MRNLKLVRSAHDGDEALMKEKDHLIFLSERIAQLYPHFVERIIALAHKAAIREKRMDRKLNMSIKVK